MGKIGIKYRLLHQHLYAVYETTGTKVCNGKNKEFSPFSAKIILRVS